MKVTDIIWDVDDPRDLAYLPTTLEISDNVKEEDIGDYLSNLTGYCHKGYVLQNS